MKRIVSIALVILMVASVLVACIKTDPTGTYVVKTMNGKSVEDALKEELGGDASLDDILELLGVDSLDNLITIEIKSDGKMTLANRMEDDTVEGTWTKESDKLFLTVDGETMQAKLNGGELSMSMDDEAYVFVKK